MRKIKIIKEAYDTPNELQAALNLISQVPECIFCFCENSVGTSRDQPDTLVAFFKPEFQHSHPVGKLQASIAWIPPMANASEYPVKYGL